MSEITYTMVGDYNLPNLKLPEQTEVTLGRWSQMRRTYLKEHHKILYYNLLTKGILNSHLAEVQQIASELEETLVKQMAQKAGLTEQIKAEDMMKWVRLMNNIRNSAQEIVKNQVIFAWEERSFTMYEYVNDKQFLSRMRSLCGDIMQDLCHTLKEEYDIGASFYLVGSGAKNLIMQNANRPIDLDYNLEITRIDDWEDCRNIKECVRKAFNTVLRKHGWNDCEDSTSSLTTEKRCFTQGNDTDFSIDVCIVCEDVDGNYHRLIHEKTGFSYYDKYFWNQAPNSRRLKEKADYIKSKGKWALVREQYKRIKNKYLTSNDYNHSSFICYIEAVNNVYNSRKHWD